MYFPLDVNCWNWFEQIMRIGYKGVDIFFFISGFVITLSIEKNGISNFWIKRFKRLFPVYWFSLIYVFILQFYGNSSRMWDSKHILKTSHVNDFIFNFTMLQRFFKIDDLDGASWTLGIELTFYLFIFFIFLFCRDFIISLLILFVFFINQNYYPMPYAFTLNYYIAGSYILLFLMGYFAFYYYKNSNLQNFIKFLIVAASHCILCFVKNDIIGCGIVLFLCLFSIYYRKWEKIFITLPLFLIRSFYFLGQISFPLYLLHGTTLYFLYNLLHTIIPFNGFIAVFFLYIFLLSFLVHKFIEDPFNKFNT